MQEMKQEAEPTQEQREQAHTPGPWEIETGLGAACVYALEEHRGKPRNRLFSQVQGGPDTPRGELIATARLIALAPTAPHYCTLSGCPGAENKRKLEAAEGLAEALRDARDVLSNEVAGSCNLCDGEGSWTDDDPPRMVPVRHREGCAYQGAIEALALWEGRE